MGVATLNPDQKKLADKLTVFQRKFVLHLIKPKITQRRAYKLAGGKSKNNASMDACACRTLRMDKVRAFYDSLMAKAENSAVMSRTEALERLSITARVKITDVCDFRYICVGEDKDGNYVMQTVWTIKNSEDIDPDVAACIKSVTMTKKGPKIEIHDQNGSIKQLSDMQGWNSPKRHEVTGKDGQALAISGDVKAPEIVDAMKGILKKL